MDAMLCECRTLSFIDYFKEILCGKVKFNSGIGTRVPGTNGRGETIEFLFVGPLFDNRKILDSRGHREESRQFLAAQMV